MIPNVVDSYIKELEQPLDENTATWVIFPDKRPQAPPVSYQMLLNLVNIANTNNPEVIWKYVINYQKSIVPNNEPFLQDMIEGAIHYYNDRIAPFKKYREPTNLEKTMLVDLATTIEQKYSENLNIEGKELADLLMNHVYEVGKRYFTKDKDKLRDGYFKMLYQVLMGQETGPRFGQFIVAYGVKDTIALLREKSK